MTDPIEEPVKRKRGRPRKNKEPKEPKKRGRKRKPKDPNKIVEKKKRGRPGRKSNSEKIEKIGRGRGRNRRKHDKYGMVVEKFGINEFNKEENIILHLPIRSSELEKRNSLESKILSYNPTMSVPKPYDPSNKMASFPFNLDSQNYNDDTDILPKNDNFKSGDYFNTSDNINIPKYDKELNLSINQLEQKRKTTIVSSSKINSEKQIELLVQFGESNKKGTWPKSTHISCFWCCYSFEGIPWGIPHKYENDKFVSFGIFCSPECASAYNFNVDTEYDEIWERYSLLNLLVSEVVESFEGIVKMAPPKLCLEKFGGIMTIDEYRESLTNYSIDYLIKIPPMTSIIPIMEEINTSPIKIKNKYIPVDKERIRKANTELRLKRSRPITECRNTLDNCMKLKYNC